MLKVLWRAFVDDLLANDEKVASSKTDIPYPRLVCKNRTLFCKIDTDQNGKNKTKNKPKKKDTLWGRTYLYSSYKGVHPYMGYPGNWYVRPLRVRFFSRFGHKQGIDLAILVTNREWFCAPSLELGMFLRRSNFFIIISKTVYKSRS